MPKALSSSSSWNRDGGGGGGGGADGVGPANTRGTAKKTTILLNLTKYSWGAISYYLTTLLGVRTPVQFDRRRDFRMGNKLTL